MTLFDHLTRARSELVAAGVHGSDAALDVEVYAREILGWDRATLLAEQRGAVPDRLEPRFSEWIARRRHSEPTAYIVGYREFWNLLFRVTPAVLIPRPETEFIVEEAIAVLRPMTAPRVADIGTGSGCLAVSLAHAIEHCTVVATDISESALVVARENAVANGVDSRIRFVCTSYLETIDESFDVIVANPPYVRQVDKDALGKDVHHEPEVALFGGNDGLRDIAGVLDTAIDSLSPGGWLVMEFGFGQEDDVRRLVAQRPPVYLSSIRHDLQGIPRTAVIRRL